MLREIDVDRDGQIAYEDMVRLMCQWWRIFIKAVDNNIILPFFQHSLCFVTFINEIMSRFVHYDLHALNIPLLVSWLDQIIVYFL
jgi:hypothetical protein